MKINWETKKDGNIEISTFAAITPNGVVINPEFQDAYDKIKKDTIPQIPEFESEVDKQIMIEIFLSRAIQILIDDIARRDRELQFSGKKS